MPSEAKEQAPLNARGRMIERIGQSVDHAASEVSRMVYQGAYPLEYMEQHKRRFTGHGRHARKRVAIFAQYLMVLGWHDHAEADKWFDAHGTTRERVQAIVFGW